MKEYNELLEKVEDMKKDFEKVFEKDPPNKAAGVRLRNQLSALAKKCKELRTLVQEKKNNS